MTAILYENHMKPLNTFSKQNAGLLTVKADGTNSYNCAVKGYMLCTDKT
jgi:hypothetical protein